MLRYVEANPLRAGLVDRADDSRWSSLGVSAAELGGMLLVPWPIERSGKWNEVVNRSLRDDELTGLRTSVERGRPFGSGDWGLETRAVMGVPFSARGTKPRVAVPLFHWGRKLTHALSNRYLF